MMRELGWLIAGALLGGIVHIVTVLLLPSVATRDAYTRLSAVTTPNQVALLPQPSPESAPLPFMDPAFATAVCRYDLSGAPLKFKTPVGQAYTSVTFYSGIGIAFYAINDRAANRRVIELDLMTPQQRGLVREDEEVTAADRLIVESPALTGMIVVRALAPEPSAMPILRDLLATAECSPMPA